MQDLWERVSARVMVSRAIRGEACGRFMRSVYLNGDHVQRVYDEHGDGRVEE